MFFELLVSCHIIWIAMFNFNIWEYTYKSRQNVRQKKQYCNCICKKNSMEADVFMTSMNTTISNLKYKQSMEYIANLL